MGFRVLGSGLSTNYTICYNHFKSFLIYLLLFKIKIKMDECDNTNKQGFMDCESLLPILEKLQMCVQEKFLEVPVVKISALILMLKVTLIHDMLKI